MSSSRFRIMVVDDEEDMRTLLAMTLSDKYEVFEATNGLDAMLKVPRYQPDLALVDIMMPLMDGHQLARRIRTTPGLEGLPVVMLSALNSKEDIKQGYDAGANLYLTKPFHAERVLRNVALALEGRTPTAKKLTITEVQEQERRQAEKVKRALEKRRTTAPKESPAPKVPATPAAAPTPQPETESPSSDAVHRPTDPLARPRVMIIDDDPDFLLLARTALEETHEVVVSENGFEALSKIPEVEPDIFVIDGMMPRMSGYQLIEILKGSMETAFKPILFVSARCSDRDKRMLATKGVEDFLEKPFTPERLTERIDAIVDRPGFLVAPKKQSIRDLLQKEGHRRAANKALEDRRKRWETARELKSFIKENE